MTPGAHLLASWVLAENFGTTHRERRLISIAGVIPDIDGIGIVADFISYNRTEYYATYHHLLCHNLLFGLLISVISMLLVKVRRLRLFAITLFAYHLHLLCDLIGSKGPDGYQWPLHYLYPFAPDIEIMWRGQWLLNGWQNALILIALFVWAIFYAVQRRRSFIEVISLNLDRQIFKAVANRWPA